MDIRNFFGAKGSSKPSKTESSKPQTVEKKKKRANVISDSDSDEDVDKKPKVEAATKKVTPKKEKDKSSSKLKEINKSDFFATSSKSSKTEPVKRKSPEKESKR